MKTQEKIYKIQKKQITALEKFLDLNYLIIVMNILNSGLDY